MKLVLVTHNIIRGDGQGRVNLEIAAHALRRGAEVYVVADKVDPELLKQGVHWSRVRPLTGAAQLPKGVEFALRASGAVARLRGQDDTVHANGHTLNCAHHVNSAHFVHSAWRRSRAAAAPPARVSAYHAYQAAHTALNAILERQAFRRARVIVAVSEKVKAELQDLGLPPSQIRVISNGVDLNTYRPGAANRAALGLPTGCLLALFAGDIRTPRKNLDTTLKALAQTPKLHLAVAGATKGSPYPALAVRLGVEDRVHFLGFRRDIADLMRTVDMFVFPSRYEACSLALLEALASGLPVITAQTAGGSEWVTPDCGAVLTDPNDVSALAAALHEMTNSPARRVEMALAARAVAEELSWEAMADKYLALYEEQC